MSRNKIPEPTTITGRKKEIKMKRNEKISKQ
jgi:hypothetical protein